MRLPSLGHPASSRSMYKGLSSCCNVSRGGGGVESQHHRSSHMRPTKATIPNLKTSVSTPLLLLHLCQKTGPWSWCFWLHCRTSRRIASCTCPAFACHEPGTMLKMKAARSPLCHMLMLQGVHMHHAPGQSQDSEFVSVLAIISAIIPRPDDPFIVLSLPVIIKIWVHQYSTCLLTSTPTARLVTFQTLPVRPW